MEAVTAYDIALIAGGFTLLGALVGGLVAYWLAVQLEASKAVVMARDQFRAAFAPTIAFIYIARHHGTHNRPDIDAHIKHALLSHGAAVEVFRRFVPASRRDGYQQAWETYRKAAAIGHDHRTYEEQHAGIKEYEVNLEKHINALLQHTDA